MKRTAALKVLVNVDISTFPYLSQQTDMGGMTAASVPPEFTDLLFEGFFERYRQYVDYHKIQSKCFFGTSLDLQLRRRGIRNHHFRRCSDNKRCIVLPH